MHELSPFHIAVPVRNLEEAREFYGNQLGFPEGRSSDHWIDFNMFGHQFVTHLHPDMNARDDKSACMGTVNNKAVPIPHFGVVLDFPRWHALAEKVSRAISSFLIEPQIRFQGQAGEQATLFFLDPSGNALEFKAFKNIDTDLFKS